MKYLYYYFILMSILGFILMGIDKYRAKRNRWRIPESRLMLLSALGGSFGVLAGMYTFRHKTRHASFRTNVPIALVIHVLLLILINYFLNKPV